MLFIYLFFFFMIFVNACNLYISTFDAEFLEIYFESCSIR